MMATWSGNGPNSKTFVSNIQTGERSWQVDLATTGHSEIKEMQQKLTNLGYSTQGADGTYGNNTKTAVVNFQKAFLGTSAADGYFGKNTLNTFVAKVGSLAGYTGSGSTPPSSGGTFTRGQFVKTNADSVTIWKTAATGNSDNMGRFPKGSIFVVNGMSGDFVCINFSNAKGEIVPKYVEKSKVVDAGPQPNGIFNTIATMAPSYAGATGNNLGIGGDYCQNFLYWLLGVTNRKPANIPYDSQKCDQAWNYFSGRGSVFHVANNPGTYYPESGDWVYYSKTDGTSTYAHVGLVMYVDRNAKTYQSIEGNLTTSQIIGWASGNYLSGSCSHTGKVVLGFARPSYN